MKKAYKNKSKQKLQNVRSGIRTHAYKSRLRPERSALDHSAILTHTFGSFNVTVYNIYNITLSPLPSPQNVTLKNDDYVCCF